MAAHAGSITRAFCWDEGVAMPSNSDLSHYPFAHADHRAEVAQSWDRARFFLGLNAALLVAGSAIAAASSRAALAPLALGVVLSVVGALIVARSHGRTRRTRDALEQAARELGVEGHEITGGQRALHGKPRGEGYRVVTLVVVGLAINSAFDAGLAIYLGCRDEPLRKPEVPGLQP